MDRILGFPRYLAQWRQLKELEGNRSRLRQRYREKINALYAPHQGWYAPKEPVDI
jgi:hypothetical protein